MFFDYISVKKEQQREQKCRLVDVRNDVSDRLRILQPVEQGHVVL